MSTSRKRASTAVEDEDGQNDKIGKNSKKKSTTPKTALKERNDNKNKKRKLDRDESAQSDESSAGKVEVAKKPKPSSSKKKLTKRKKYNKDDEKREPEAIVSHRPGIKGKRTYLIKWKDSDETTWKTTHYVRVLCLDLLREYNEALRNEDMVEAILSHKRHKKRKFKYLIKWKDHSKGETWESLNKVTELCPKLLRAYTEKIEKAEMKELEVEDITSYKFVDQNSKYLIKWKDKSKGETWETARRTIALCPEILDKFTKKNPDCKLVVRDNPTRNVYGADLLKTTKVIRSLKKLKGEEKEWEVKQIEDVRINEDDTREFLIKWKGYKPQCDSWEAEENLNCSGLIKKFMAKTEKAKNASQKGKRPLRSSERHDRKQRADTDADAHADTNADD